MKIVSTKQMKKLDLQTIRRHRVSGITLMWRAGSGAFRSTESFFSPSLKQEWTILAGTGNNGGDAWVIASLAKKKGYSTRLFLVGSPTQLTPDAHYYFAALKEEVTFLQKKADLKKLKKALKNSSIVVDGLFGTGLHQKVQGLYGQVIQLINEAPCKKMALDIPSGIHGDSGEVLGIAFRADLTLTFELPKWGHFLKEGPAYSGALKIIPIGIPKTLTSQIKTRGQMIDSKQVQKVLPKRSRTMHKTSAGRALVVAGSKNFPGAGILAALGVLRSGCGYCTLAFPEGVLNKTFFDHPEVILHPLSSNLGYFSKESSHDLNFILKEISALGIGCGMGKKDSSQFLVHFLLKNFKGPMVIDADGLYHSKSFFKNDHSRQNRILTPHPGEMAFLLGKQIQEIEANRMKWVRHLAKSWGVYIILKGHRTILSTPSGELYFNPTGTMTLATAGSGDILAGLITGFLCQGMSPLLASKCGIFLHGKVGDFLYHHRGDRGFTATDILNSFPEVLQTVKKGLDCF